MKTSARWAFRPAGYLAFARATVMALLLLFLLLVGVSWLTGATNIIAITVIWPLFVVLSFVGANRIGGSVRIQGQTGEWMHTTERHLKVS